MNQSEVVEQESLHPQIPTMRCLGLRQRSAKCVLGFGGLRSVQPEFALVGQRVDVLQFLALQVRLKQPACSLEQLLGLLKLALRPHVLGERREAIRVVRVLFSMEFRDQRLELLDNALFVLPTPQNPIRCRQALEKRDVLAGVSTAHLVKSDEGPL
jgi:hypothetical protein